MNHKSSDRDDLVGSDADSRRTFKQNCLRCGTQSEKKKAPSCHALVSFCKNIHWSYEIKTVHYCGRGSM